MIKIVVFLVVVLVCAAVGLSFMRGKGLVRGVSDGAFVSTGRPALAVVPEKGFEPTEAARLLLSARVQGSALRTASVPAAYAAFAREGEAGPERLIALLATSDEDRAEWPVRPDAVFSSFRRASVVVDGKEGFAETFVLPEEEDPWRAGASPEWKRGSLVRRFTFLPWFRKAKLIVEYREPTPSSPLPLEDDVPLAAAFEKRAADAFSLRGAEGLPRPAKPPYPPKSLDRRRLARYVGDLWANDAK